MERALDDLMQELLSSASDALLGETETEDADHRQDMCADED